MIRGKALHGVSIDAAPSNGSEGPHSARHGLDIGKVASDGDYTTFVGNQLHRLHFAHHRAVEFRLLTRLDA